MKLTFRRYRAASVGLLRHEWARLDAGDRLPHVFVQVAEDFGRPLGLDPCLLLDLMADVVVRRTDTRAAVAVYPS
jgi:hypothetical protein